MRAIYVPLRAEERAALLNVSQRERRDPRDQAAYLIAEGLKRAGVLPEPKNAAGREPATAARP